MPVVIVEMLDEQTLENKKRLAQDLTQAFVNIGIPAGEVHVIMRENPKSCWADAGKLCSESEYKLPPGA